MTTMPVWPLKAWVVAQAPDDESVFVLLGGPFGGAGPALPVQVMSQGPRDAVVGRFPALPTAGTHGLVVFPSGDSRNGVWMGSISTQQTDASAHVPGNGAADYAAHYGGGWSMRSADGQTTEVFPDGTMVQVGPVTPVPTRHTIDENQQRQRTHFLPAQRIPQKPNPFPVLVQHASGASVSIDSAGSIALIAAAGQTVSLSVSGGVTLTLSGSTLAVGSDTTVTIASSTSISLQAPIISCNNGGGVLPLRRSDNSITTVLVAQ